MILPEYSENPVRIQLSFNELIERLEQSAVIDEDWYGKRAQELLRKVALVPELRDGITQFSQIENNTGLISELLAELFPAALTNNEIKAVTMPFQGLLINPTKRFQKILKDAGPDFEAGIRDFDEHQFYVLSCCIILNEFYGTNLDFSKPLFYDIPAAEGFTRHYRILYNVDFTHIIPTESAVKLTPEDIDLLTNNYDDLSLWKEKFPEGSWILKGFAIMTLVDVTIENALSILKSNLLGSVPAPDLQHRLASIFRSIFKIKDIKMGFTSYDPAEGRFSNIPIGPQVHSFLLPNNTTEKSENLLCNKSHDLVMRKHSYFTVSDVDAYISQEPGNYVVKHLQAQGAKSFILAPIVKNGVLLGVLELVSPRAKELNSVTANKLGIVMPFLIDTIDSKVNEMQNRVQAVIHNTYTTLHPSVYWRFRQEAEKHIYNSNMGLSYAPADIMFNDVYPLYGQVDIQDSSITRNLSVKNDLLNLLNHLTMLLEELDLPSIESTIFELQKFVNELSVNVKTDTEQHIQHYLEEHIHPLLKGDLRYNASQRADIQNYFAQHDPKTGEFHTNRRNYEKTLSLVNEKMIDILDSRQAEIQAYLPHYYERFKTDGVEHNMYIGASILQNKQFNLTDLRRLRLWELMVIAEIEIAHHHLKPILPYQVNVTSLILVLSTPVCIRFRMDEKHFDIDGAYSIRYEVIKKRIDKAHIKNTDKRITHHGKITIIYSSEHEEQEYLQYIQILREAKILDEDIEYVEVEDLQGVSGLRAMRVGVLHNQVKPVYRTVSYEALYKQLN